MLQKKQVKIKANTFNSVRRAFSLDLHLRCMLCLQIVCLDQVNSRPTSCKVHKWMCVTAAWKLDSDDNFVIVFG